MVRLYWLPLGAGGEVVRRCGRLYEQVRARREHRAAAPLFHSALEVGTHERRFVIEMTPAWRHAVPGRGVVLTGPVGARPLGRSALFRYEVRCWPDGVVDDLEQVRCTPVVLADTDGRADLLPGLVRAVPALVWGRDELRAGDMWNSNSVTAFVLAAAGFPAGGLRPPGGGRAPGWRAGLVAATRARSSVRGPGPEGG